MVLMQMTDQSIIAVVMKVFHIHNVYSRIQNISTCQSFERNSLLLQFSTQSFSRKIARMVLQTFQLHFTVTFHCRNGSGVALVQPSRMNFPSCISPIVEGGGGVRAHAPMPPDVLSLFLFVNDCWLTYRASQLFPFEDKINRIRYLTTVLTFHFTSPLGQFFTLNVALRLRDFHCSFYGFSFSFTWWIFV